MGKTLIITEKPSVAREYANILHVGGNGNGKIENKDYVITWCVGHLVEMSYPEKYDAKYSKWNLADLPFLPREYKYDVIDQVKKQYEIVNGLMNSKDISLILYAGDSGREGQVIIELIRRFGGVAESITEKRVWIDSCTEDEILRGIKEAKPIEKYDNIANAGIMRGIEDYAMGINFSRALSVKYGRMLNKAANNTKYAAIAIGRVMTCVLGMVVRREREIREFVETPFYRISGDFAKEGLQFSGEWKVWEKSQFFDTPFLYKDSGLKGRDKATDLIKILNNADKAVVDSIKKTNEKKKAPLLFNLAELQAECSKRFKISPEETLKIVQQLYEKKMTTYPRTDARVLTTAIAGEIEKNIMGLLKYEPISQYAKEILDGKLYEKLEKTPYVDDKKVTDHYAIIPTGNIAEYMKASPIEKNVFDLIVRRFLSIFFPAAVFQKANIVLNVENEQFVTNVRVLSKAGYLVIAKNDPNSDKPDCEQESVSDNNLLDVLSKVKKGEEIEVNGFAIKDGKTSPPKRYTSGSMVLAMENAGKLIEDEELRAQIKGAGIGTSATRAGIIDKLIRIGYLKLNKKTQILSPEKFGEMVYEVVFITMPSMLNPEMTASWEKGLAGVEEGKISVETYTTKLNEYVRKYIENVKGTDLIDILAKRIGPFATGTEYEDEGCSDNHKIGAKCPLCGGEVCTTPFGFGCSNYGKKEENCRFSIGRIAKRRISEGEAIKLLNTKHTGVLNGFISKRGTEFSAALLLNDQGKIEFDFDQK